MAWPLPSLRERRTTLGTLPLPGRRASCPTAGTGAAFAAVTSAVTATAAPTRLGCGGGCARRR